MIYRWARDQFGDAVTPLSIAIRMNKEMSELLSALQYGQMEGAREECADLLVMLSQIHFILSSGCRDGTLVDDMNTKMEINKRRAWKISSDGSHQHIEENDPDHPNYTCPICDGGPGNDGVCLCPKEY
jgi:NTP pyrophosphatase (non-canonical NTP hydrolase)